MDKCPICETTVSEESQDYCLNCAWEFEYYFDELSDDEKKRYETRFEIWKSKFNGKIEPVVICIDKKKQEVEISKSYGVLISIAWAIFSIGFISLCVINANSVFGEYYKLEGRLFIGVSISILFWFVISTIRRNRLGEFEKFIYWVVISVEAIFFFVAFLNHYDVSFLGEYAYEDSGIVIGIIISLLIWLFIFIRREKVMIGTEKFIHWSIVSGETSFLFFILFSTLTTIFLSVSVSFLLFFLLSQNFNKRIYQ